MQTATQETPQHIRQMIPIGSPLPGEGELSIAADIFIPEQLSTPALVFFCLPGGAMSRTYYDLRVGSDCSYSFVQAMLGHGFIVVTIDHIGIGASSRPVDGYAITPEHLINSNAQVCAQILAQLQSGSLASNLTPLPELRSIGVGHSMGALLTVMQQGRKLSHSAIVLLGFGTRGLTEHLSDAERVYAGDPDGAHANIVALGKLRYPTPYYVMTSNPASRAIFKGADRAAADALKVARDHLLPAPSLFSMIPGSCIPEAHSIKAPVLIAVGDEDICGPLHEIPADFPQSLDVTLLVLKETGHSHFLFPSRAHLFTRVAQWAREVLR